LQDDVSVIDTILSWVLAALGTHHHRPSGCVIARHAPAAHAGAHAGGRCRSRRRGALRQRAPALAANDTRTALSSAVMRFIEVSFVVRAEARQAG
jgi:hypothetical protein